MLMNYEAEIYYFPVNWRSNKNPRETLKMMLPGNYPPCGDYRLYEKNTHQNIDYILFQNWKEDYKKQSCGDSTLKIIESNFTKIFESENQYVVVFKRK